MAQIPTVSVCTASYNHARFLPATLDSILGQTFRDFELIVLDDGSADNSLEILESYARRNPAIVRVLTHPGHQNLGTSVTDNVMIEESTGVYWCGHASDDVSYSERLERQVAFLESHPDIGWVYGIADYIDKHGKKLKGQFGQDLTTVSNLAEELILGNRICGATAMVRMDCMKKIGPFEPGLMYGDWEFWVRLAGRYPGAFLPGAVAGYRCHDYNTSMSFFQSEDPVRRRENISHSLEVIATLRRKADTAEGPLGQPRKKALLDLRRAAFLLELNDKESASLAVAAAFRSDPSFRDDFKHLAYCIDTLDSRSLAFMIIRQLGFPPRWLGDRAFLAEMRWLIGL